MKNSPVSVKYQKTSAQKKIGSFFSASRCIEMTYRTNDRGIFSYFSAFLQFFSHCPHAEENTKCMWIGYWQTVVTLKLGR